ncbi:radical SAM protein [Arcobacter sp. KX21116]|uniref:radical SAM protein n=1 Tax=Arcobacter iocasae TaxID=2906515 RepID=UPI0035D4318E
MLDKNKFLYVEWVITYQCNFSCNYCFFRDNLAKNAYMFKNRGPKLPKNKFQKYAFYVAKEMGIFNYADSFKNYKIEEWIKLFKTISETKDELYLSFTGGEPLVLYKKLNKIILELSKMFKKLNIRIDTNGSVIPIFDDEIKKYISYNVSYHPSQIDVNQLLSNLKKIDDNGKVLMVNRVVFNSDIESINQEIILFKDKGYFLNINPAHFSLKGYSEKNIEVIKSIKAPIDFNNSLKKNNVGKLCSYPMFGLQLLPSGYAWIPPCDNKNVVNLIKKPHEIEKLLKKEKFACPSECVCFHQYPFSTNNEYKDNDIMNEYVERNVRHRIGTI